MINDILTISPQHIKYSLYADDVALWCTHNNLIEGIKLIQHTLQHIENWCTKWGLVLSPSKSVAMIFAPKEPNFLHPNLHINNTWGVQRPTPHVEPRLRRAPAADRTPGPNLIKWRTEDLAAPTGVKVLESGSKRKMFCTPSRPSYRDVTDNVFSSINVHLILLIPL